MKIMDAEQKEALTGGNAVVRFLTVSYFIALALGIVPGTDMTVLTGPFMNGPLGSIVTSGVILALSTLILLGWYRRAAALSLAICVFWASYLAVMAAPTDAQLSAFWRDLILIGALVMTYADAKTDRPAPFQKTRESSEEKPVGRISRAISTTRSIVSSPSASKTGSRRKTSQTEVYRKDLDIARAS